MPNLKQEKYDCCMWGEVYVGEWMEVEGNESREGKEGNKINMVMS